MPTPFSANPTSSAQDDVPEEGWTEESRESERPRPEESSPESIPAVLRTTPPPTDEPAAQSSADAAESASSDAARSPDSASESPIVTAGEADDVDIDLLIADEDFADVEPLSIKADDIEPAGSESLAGAEIAKEAAHISDAEFDAARGRPASMPPESGASAGVSHEDLLRADIVTRLRKAGVSLDDANRTSTAVLKHMGTVLIDGFWIGDEQTIRNVIATTLEALDPATYRDKREDLMRAELHDVKRIFLRELEKGNVPAASKLEAGLQGPEKSPPPLPAPPRPATQKTAPPLTRSSKKR